MLIRLQDMVRRGEIIDNDTEDEFYLRRLDAGLFVLQHICYIMAEICNANVPQVGGAAPDGPVHACLLPGPLPGQRLQERSGSTLLNSLHSVWARSIRGGHEVHTLHRMDAGVCQDKQCFSFLSPPFPFLTDSPEGSPDPEHARELHQNRQAHHQG